MGIILCDTIAVFWKNSSEFGNSGITLWSGIELFLFITDWHVLRIPGICSALTGEPGEILSPWLLKFHILPNSII